MNGIKRLAVFCGSSTGRQEVYREIGVEVGEWCADHQIAVVYGGAQIGIMGAVADGCLSRGGQVVGVLPHFLDQVEISHTGITEMIRVDSMHSRKQKMYEMADAVLILPGGFGTLDELFEVLTWGQLGLHQMPIVILNVGGYYDLLISMADWMCGQGFVRQDDRNRLISIQHIHELEAIIRDVAMDSGHNNDSTVVI
jgi:uncharacterized protein (TIGR00730 family)